MNSRAGIVSDRMRASAYVLLLCVLGTLAAFMFWPSEQATARKPMAGGSGPVSFFAAAEDFRAGRYASAYQQFVVLADRGDVDASRVALFMYRFGPSVYGSAWSASVEQIATWTARSQTAEDRDLAHLRPVAPRCTDAQR